MRPDRPGSAASTDFNSRSEILLGCADDQTGPSDRTPEGNGSELSRDCPPRRVQPSNRADCGMDAAGQTPCGEDRAIRNRARFRARSRNQQLNQKTHLRKARGLSSSASIAPALVAIESQRPLQNPMRAMASVVMTTKPKVSHSSRQARAGLGCRSPLWACSASQGTG